MDFASSYVKSQVDDSRGLSLHEKASQLTYNCYNALLQI